MHHVNVRNGMVRIIVHTHGEEKLLERAKIKDGGLRKGIVSHHTLG